MPRGRDTPPGGGAIALPRTGASGRRRGSLAPSRRSLLAGLALLVLAGAVYAAARETSLFAIRTLTITGAAPPVVEQVERVLTPLLGRSLVGLDGGAMVRRIDALPTVVNTTYDRSFPHTLRVTVVPERPVAVLRHGRASWLVSARGRLLGRIARDSEPQLPRIWLPTAASVGAPGDFLALTTGGAAARALVFARDFPVGIATAAVSGGVLIFHLRSGLSLRLGDSGDLRLKLAVARRALHLLPPGTTYLDVGVPGRPVAGVETGASTNPQLSGGG
jgi:hypothetical protein